MPSVEENLRRWTEHEWPAGGEEWSTVGGGSRAIWHGIIYPRLMHFLPPVREPGHVLEIAPGFGRWTQYLLPLSRRLTLVDLTPRCIEECRARFGRGGLLRTKIAYHVNDGRSLGMVAPNSVDLAFSWDSLVHVEEDVMRDYARELARTLRPGGVAILHHSNLATYIDPHSGELQTQEHHWRARSMSAAKMREHAASAGLDVVVQELRTMGTTRDEAMIDCISLLRRPTGSPGDHAPVIIENSAFWREMQAIGRTTKAYVADDRGT
ncbi:MAG: class I SAM-dependent methyltransferase [Phycisphaerales bacterium]|jgi:SAM-dependent methyltransferase|nr:class I SAM-dependent methyltransferase [Phycisphaerales bacterium]